MCQLRNISYCLFKNNWKIIRLFEVILVLPKHRSIKKSQITGFWNSYISNVFTSIFIFMLVLVTPSILFLSQFRFHHNNPLVPQVFFMFIFERYPNIGSYRLQTHRGSVHRNFFPQSPYIILGSKFWLFVHFCAHKALKG